MKNMTKWLSLLMALTMVLGLLPAAVAEEAPAEAIDTGYLMYADTAWAKQYWGEPEAPEGVTVTNAQITGEGDYTVGLEFAEPAEGLAFAAVGIVNGEKTLPKHYIRINAIRVNGEAIEVKKGYTSSDDGICTRMNIYNEWVSELPADAHSYDGKLDDANWIIVDKEKFASVSKVEVDFSVIKNAQDTAYIMYADTAWAKQYWGEAEAPAGVTPTNATITGAGDYSVGLEFAEPAEGVAFTALGIVNGEKTYPGYFLKINEMRVNGEAIEVKKGYTSSDDGICTRMNIYNEWVSELPADARSFDGTLDDAGWIIVDKEKFASVSKIEIDFSLIPVTDTAYLMYADTAWAKQYWGEAEAPAGVTATTAKVEGPGTYTVGLSFAEPAEGLAFAAVGVTTGEKTFPGYFIKVTEMKVNGEAIDVKKGYTSSDDGICTRSNLYNEWVTELPKDAHSYDGVLDDAGWIVVDKEKFAKVNDVTVTFEYIYGEPMKAEEGTLTEEQAQELLKADYNAYVGCQTTSYIFRNEWNEASYGKEANPEFFARLTGWDGDVAVDYAGTFEDAAITGNGTYTVTMTTGDKGFGTDEAFRMLYVSTDIPYALVNQGYVTISDVQVKIGDARTQEHTEIIKGTGDMARITLVDEYNQSEAPFGYTMPGPNTTVTVTFTVSGLAE